MLSPERSLLFYLPGRDDESYAAIFEGRSRRMCTSLGREIEGRKEGHNIISRPHAPINRARQMKYVVCIWLGDGRLGLRIGERWGSPYTILLAHSSSHGNWMPEQGREREMKS